MERISTRYVRRPRMTRRTLLGCLGIAGLGISGAACAPAASPTPSAVAPSPAATAPPAPSPVNKPPATAAPAAKATTVPSPPAKRTFQPAKVKLAYSTSPRVDSARLVGVKQGFFRDFAIDLDAVQLTGGGADIIRAAVSDEVTLASPTGEAALVAIEGGAPLKLLGTYEAKLGHIFFARPEVKTLKDLEGKSIGITAPGSLVDNITRQILRKEGVDASKIEFISLQGSAGIYQALVANKVAGGAATDAFLATAQRDGVVALVKTWEVLPNYVTALFAATDQEIKKYRDEIVRTFAGFAKTFRYLTDPASKAVWIDVATSELKQERGQAEIAWQGMFEAKAFPADLGLSKAQIDYLQQLNVESGKQKGVMPFDQIVDFSLLKEALALV